ncbi:hypothetical protein [Fusobacterium hwasookii]|uniref:hypothetical protein n=1 Tax=Fusobacterium hwasookii TaxID=1583098 RepID=UPI0028E1B498|nr:hypothetical protein [Fusobacterium hwasookii]
MLSNSSLVVPQQDISFILQQPENEVNLMLAGMLSLINKNETLNESLQSQSWCKRMFNTIIGKNKATALEIQQNHDKLNAYVVQVVGQLYDMNKISSQIMVSLGLQITQLYNSHLELKNILFSLASKLNKKIESVDNYHTLLQEIDEGFYTSDIRGLLSVISQIDYRMISDLKKMELLKKKLSNKNLLGTGNQMSVKSFLIEISNISGDILGAVYADLQLYQTDYILVALAINTIEFWNLLPLSNQKILKKQTVINRIIENVDIDETSEISLDEFYNEVITLRQNLFNDSKIALMATDSVFSDDVNFEKVKQGNTNNLDIIESVESSGEDDEFDNSLNNFQYTLSELSTLLECTNNNDEVSEYNNDDISEMISNYIEYYLGSESSCTTYTGYIGYSLREKAKRNIVDKSDTISAVAGAVIGGVLFGPLGGVLGAAMGNKGKSKQEFTCDVDDIIAIVDASSFNNCKDGLVFTTSGIFFSQTGNVSMYIRYSDIAVVNGTTGLLGGKLQVERYLGDDFIWTDTIIPKDKVAKLLNAIRNIC